MPRPKRTQLNQELAHNIVKWAKAKGVSQAAIKRKVNVNRSTVSRWFSGETSPEPHHQQMLADLFGIDVADLGRAPDPDEMEGNMEEGDSVQPLRYVSLRLRIQGIVEAGHFAMRDLAMDYGSRIIALPEQFKDCRPFLLKVKGESMNLEFADGALIVCAHLYDLHEEPIEGKLYIVRRTNPDGLVESTVKQFRRDAQGHAWAWPISSDPRYQTPWRLDGDQPDDVTVDIHARVILSLKVH